MIKRTVANGSHGIVYAIIGHGIGNDYCALVCATNSIVRYLNGIAGGPIIVNAIDFKVVGVGYESSNRAQQKHYQIQQSFFFHDYFVFYVITIIWLYHRQI